MIVLAGIFSGCLVAANILAAKIVVIGPLVVPGGVLAYSLTFLITDITAEVWGEQEARRVVRSGIVTLVLALALMSVTLLWPSPVWWKNTEAFSLVVGQGARIIVAGMIAFVVSQYLDVWVFARIREKTDGGMLWLRNNGSTILSQLVDSFVFVVVAFYGILPAFELILGNWIVKIGIALLDTPLVYAGVWYFKRNKA